MGYEEFIRELSRHLTLGDLEGARGDLFAHANYWPALQHLQEGKAAGLPPALPPIDAVDLPSRVARRGRAFEADAAKRPVPRGASSTGSAAPQDEPVAALPITAVQQA